MKNRFLKAVFSVITAAGVLMLPGCYPSEKRVNESDISSGSSESTHFDGSHFEYEGENVSVSFDIPEVPDELP